jgi:hypothetical protein
MDKIYSDAFFFVFFFFSGVYQLGITADLYYRIYLYGVYDALFPYELVCVLLSGFGLILYAFYRGYLVYDGWRLAVKLKRNGGKT